MERPLGGNALFDLRHASALADQPSGLVDLQACAAADGQTPEDISRFLPWNLSDERRDQLNAQPPPAAFDTS